MNKYLRTKKKINKETKTERRKIIPFTIILIIIIIIIEKI